MIENIKIWSTQKKVFYGLAGATLLSGLIYGVMKIKIYSESKKNKK